MVRCFYHSTLLWLVRTRHCKGTTISYKGKGATIQIYYFWGSEICRLPYFSLSKIKAFWNKKTAQIIEPCAKGYYQCCFCSIISSVVYLRCRMQFSAKPMNRKRFYSCLLSNGGIKFVQMRVEPSLLELCRVQPSFCKLLQTFDRLTCSYSILLVSAKNSLGN